MKLVYVKVRFEDNSKEYNYYSTEEVKVGDCALVYAPRGPALVTVSAITKENQTARQPLLSIIDKEMLHKQRDVVQARAQKYISLKASLDGKLQAVKEKEYLDFLKAKDPSLAVIIEEMNSL